MDPRFNNTTRVAALVAATLLANTTVVAAQRPSATRRAQLAAERAKAAADARMKGVSFGVYTIAAPGVTVSGGFDGAIKTSLGPGAGLMVGYGFNRIWTSYVSLDLAKQSATASDYEGSFGLSHLEIGTRAYVPTQSPKNLPYLSASFGRRAIGARVFDNFDGETYDMSFSGGMFSVGGGVQHVMSPSVMLDGGLQVGFGSFSHWSADGDSGSASTNGTTSIRFKFGMTWRPTARRSA
jgi:hypothetical protein